MATLRALTSTTRYAIAGSQGHVQADVAWLILDQPGNADYTWDSEPKMSIPDKSVMLGYDGNGAPQYGGRPGGAAAPRGLWHKFTWTFPPDRSGASWQLLQDLLNTFPTGGACTVKGLDPYGVPVSSQRGTAYCYWDCEMQGISTQELIMYQNGANLTLTFNAATCRTS